MRKLVAVPIVLWCAVSALGQSGPGTCTSNTPDGVPCFDSNFGDVVRFSPPVPTKKLPSFPPPETPVVIPEGQPPKLTLPAVSNDFQYWSYQSDGSCDYHEGPNVQHLGASTLQNYVSNRAQLGESYQAGEVIGSAVGALVRAWVVHHQRVVHERNDIRQQISGYYNAAFDLIDEVMREQDIIALDFTLLAGLDPARRSIYERGAGNAAEFKVRLATQRPAGKKMLAEILATKKVKDLRSDLPLAQKTYQAAQNGAEQEYVYSRFVGGLAGYFEYQQKAHPISTTEGQH